jgi:hypothetical protein
MGTECCSTLLETLPLCSAGDLYPLSSSNSNNLRCMFLYIVLDEERNVSQQAFRKLTHKSLHKRR